jgi:hypothetical protein
MKIHRLDFVDDNNCFSCKHKLPRKIAYIVEQDNGEEVPYGPVCIRRFFDKIINVPNFTKASMEYTIPEKKIVKKIILWILI